MNLNEARPISAADDDSQSWWDATAAGRLTVQRCATCGHAQLYPRALCVSCHGADLALSDATGRGTVHSYTIVHRAPHPAFETPYVVALVRLDEGPVVMSNIVECASESVRCDMRVAVAWEALPDGRQLPLFKPE